MSSRDSLLDCPRGDTDTGKTTLLDLLGNREIGIFREYSTLVMATSLIAKPNQQDATAMSDLADLCGARLAQTSEFKEGMVIDEALLKRLTPGNATIRGCRKYELPFSFRATHKLWIDNNYAIDMRATTDDVWGRIIPFTFGPRIPKDQIDKKLPAALRKETEGIFALLCRASRAWYRQGLGALPEAVVEKREEWRSNADRVRRFVDECCVPDVTTLTAPRDFYESYSLWDREGGERPMSETMFNLKLKEQGWTKDGRMYKAVRLVDGWRERIEALKNARVKARP